MLTWISTLLTMSVLGSPGREWLLQQATFNLLTGLFLTSHIVRCCLSNLMFALINGTTSLWVSFSSQLANNIEF